jgi:hypothetical protein
MAQSNLLSGTRKRGEIGSTGRARKQMSHQNLDRETTAVAHPMLTKREYRYHVLGKH